MRIASFYFIYFSCIGLIVPYLAAYFRTLGFTGHEVSTAMSLSPLAMIFIPPIWGLVADRTQRPALILCVACAGVMLSFLPLMWADRFLICVAIMGINALFHSPITALSDTVAVQEAKRMGTTYARLRLWGSIGFMVSSLSFGWYRSCGGSLNVLPMAITGSLVLAFMSACLIRQPKERVRLAPPALKDVWRLIRRPSFLTFLIAGAIHWSSCSPSFILFTIHLEDLKIDPIYAGIAFFLGVAAEVIMMWGYRHVEKRISLFPLMGLSFALTSLRWFVMARIDDGLTLAVIQVLHAFTFGAFYVGVITYLDETVPPALRATGRALFTSISIGLGGLVGHQLAGLMYDLGQAHEIGGGKLAFHVAAAVEWLAPIALYLSYRWRPRKPASNGDKATNGSEISSPAGPS